MPKLRFRLARSIGDHGQKGTFVGDEAAGFLRNTTECPTDTQSLSERFYDRNSPQSSALNQLEVFDPLLLLLALLKRGR